MNRQKSAFPYLAVMIGTTGLLGALPAAADHVPAVVEIPSSNAGQFLPPLVSAAPADLGHRVVTPLGWSYTAYGTARGAQGPIREGIVTSAPVRGASEHIVSLPPYAHVERNALGWEYVIYDSTPSARGAQGPIRNDEASLARDASEQWWRRVLGPVGGENTP